VANVRHGKDRPRSRRARGIADGRGRREYIPSLSGAFACTGTSITRP
jgi:hypothetical protein